MGSGFEALHTSSLQLESSKVRRPAHSVRLWVARGVAFDFKMVTAPVLTSEDRWSTDVVQMQLAFFAEAFVFGHGLVKACPLNFNKYIIVIQLNRLVSLRRWVLVLGRFWESRKSTLAASEPNRRSSGVAAI